MFIRPFTGTGCWGKIDTGTAADKDHPFRLSWKIADLSWPLVISNKFPQHKTICLRLDWHYPISFSSVISTANIRTRALGSTFLLLHRVVYM